MPIQNKLLNAAVLGLLISALGCSEKHERLLIQGEAPLLENPYPMGYPSTKPRPNRSIRLLKDERVVILSERIEKDYMVYKVRTKDGAEGYLMAGSQVKKEKGVRDN